MVQLLQHTHYCHTMLIVLQDRAALKHCNLGTHLQRCKGLTNMPDCVGEYYNEKTPDCWMYNEAEKEQLIDARPAGYKPGGKATPKE